MRGRSQDLPLAVVNRDDAEEKLSAANALHATKVRSLMNSINKLQKENANLKKDSLEHQRTKAFQRIQAELGQQDIMLNALKDVIIEQKFKQVMNEIDEQDPRRREAMARKIAEATPLEIIQKALERGPPRYRPQTREELKHALDDKKEALSNCRARLQKAREQAISIPVAWAEEDAPKSPRRGAAELEETGGRAAELEGALQMTQSRLDAVTRENDSHRIECKSLQRVVEKQTEELGRLQRGIFSRTADGAAKEQLAIMEQKLQLKEGELKRLRDYKEKAEEQVAAKQKEALALGKEAGDFAAQRAKLKADADEGQRDVSVGLHAKLNAEKKKFLDMQAQMEKRIKTLNDSKKDIQSILDKKNHEIKSLKVDAQRAQREAHDAKENADKLKKQTASFEQTLEEFDGVEGVLLRVKNYDELKKKTDNIVKELEDAKNKHYDEIQVVKSDYRALLDKDRIGLDGDRRTIYSQLDEERAANDKLRESLLATEAEMRSAKAELNKGAKELARAKLGQQASEEQVKKYMAELEQRGQAAVAMLLGKQTGAILNWILNTWRQYAADRRMDRLKAAQAGKLGVQKDEEEASVSVSMSLTVDYEQLSAHDKDELKGKVQDILAKNAGTRQSAVSVKLTPGSVKVDAEIQAPNANSGESLARMKSSIEQEVLEAANSIPGVMAAAIGGIIKVTMHEVNAEPRGAIEDPTVPPGEAGSEDPMDDGPTEDDFQVIVGWDQGVTNAVKCGYNQKGMVDAAEHPDHLLWARHIQPRDDEIKALKRRVSALQEDLATQTQEIETLKARPASEGFAVEHDPEELLRAYERADDLEVHLCTLQEENTMLQKQLNGAKMMVRKAQSQSRSASPAVHQGHFCPYCEHCRFTHRPHRGSSIGRGTPPAPSPPPDEGAGVGALTSSPEAYPSQPNYPSPPPE